MIGEREETSDARQETRDNSRTSRVSCLASPTSHHTEDGRWPVLVIGYGNDLRGDDAVGLRVAAAVSGWHMAGMRAVAVHQLTPELAEQLAMARLAIFVDASCAGSSVSTDGGVPRVRVQPLIRGTNASSFGHIGDPCQLLALTRALYGTEPRAWLVTVPAATFGLGAALSPTASAGVRAALYEILRLIRSELCTKLD